MSLNMRRNVWANRLYGATMFYCAPAMRSDGDPGFGALTRRSEIHELARQAGFLKFRRLRVDSPYDVLYKLKL